MRGWSLIAASWILSLILLSCGYPDATAPIGAGESESTTETGPAGDGDDDGEPVPEREPVPGPPEAPVLELSLSQVKQFDFHWLPVLGATHYQLLESVDAGDPHVQVGEDVLGSAMSLTVPLHFRLNASYLLRACNAKGCTDSQPVDVVGGLIEAIGYFKASNTEAEDRFGYPVALSGDGNTLAVSASLEDSSAIGIGGDQADNSAENAGAVYVFVRDGQDAWSQQVYLKASNSGPGDRFGQSLALSDDGNTLAVGAPFEDSKGTDLPVEEADDSANDAGAVYVFVRDGQNIWSQQDYIKASNADEKDRFGSSVALARDGNTLAVGAPREASNAVGIGGAQALNLAPRAGAVYVFVRDGQDIWSQHAYIKASNTEGSDFFGSHLALSGDGKTLAVGAPQEDSTATGIGGDQNDNGADNVGAVYVFVRDAQNIWSQQAYIKASNSGEKDHFGDSVALSADGNTLAVGTPAEASSATGIEGDQADNSAAWAGAVYVFVRDGQNAWSQQAYIKASNSKMIDHFGITVVLSSDGDTLAVGAQHEESIASGIGGDQADDFASAAGAVYVFVRDGQNAWSQQAYVKASNTNMGQLFGTGLALSGDASVLAVGAYAEDGGATGIGGNQDSAARPMSGAVYLY